MKVVSRNNGQLHKMNNIKSNSYCAEESMASGRSTVDLSVSDETGHSPPVAIEMPDDLYSTAEGGNASARIKPPFLCGEVNEEPEDYGEAFRCHLEAADRGDRLAQFSVGVRYLEGLGARRNFKEASRWLLLAAEKGEPSTQTITPDQISSAWWRGKALDLVWPQRLRRYLSAEYNF